MPPWGHCAARKSYVRAAEKHLYAYEKDLK